MQLFNPWTWRDPSALAGGYDQTAPADVPRQRREGSDHGPDAPADVPRQRREGSDHGPDAPGPGTPLDLTGYRVEATDGRIGSIDEASEEADARYLVVDTGPWIFGRKVLLPVGTVERVDHLERTVYVDRTRDQVKNSPAFDPEEFARPDYRERVGSYYEQTYRRG